MKQAYVWTGFILSLFLSGAPTQAVGQTRACIDRATLLERLEARYQEIPVFRALMNTGGILEILSTADGATWTVTVTLPNGTSCVVASGRYWQAVPPPKPGEES